MSKITDKFRVSALRNGVIIRPAKNVETPEAIRMAAMIEMLNLGFKVDLTELSGMSEAALTTMIKDARTVIGADRNMRPIYPGFPKQVQDLDTLTLLVEQILHYWTGGAFLPNYPDMVREGLPLADMVRNTRALSVKTASDAATHFIHTLTTRGVALSADDRDLLWGAVALHHPSIEQITATLRAARNGENKQTLVMALYAEQVLTAEMAVLAAAATATNLDQLLRAVLAVATIPVDGREVEATRAVQNLSDRDSRSIKMVTLSRPARRAVLTRLGDLSDGFHADSLLGRVNLWRRVMRMVHPFTFPEAREGTAVRRAVDIIHENVQHQTLNSLVEKAMAEQDVKTVVALLAEHQPGNLLRRLGAILRFATSTAQVRIITNAVRTVGGRSTLSTLISAYNGVLSLNDTRARVTRVAGLTNTMVDRDKTRQVPANYVVEVASALKDALTQVLATKPAPAGVVGVNSDQAVPLVRRDAATTDRVMDRGQTLGLLGEGDTVRVFSHWVNKSHKSGYIDVGAAVLDSDFNELATVTWNTWSNCRAWSTYSGDKHVYPGDDAAEYIDVDIDGVRKKFKDASWVVMTLQSWSGFNMVNDVDMIAGVMLRSKPNSGEVFDPRTVTTAFRPTTDAMQAIPFAVNLHTKEMVWLDSSSGSMATGVSAANDQAVGAVVYDEVARPRLTLGELATLWADAHGADTSDEGADRDALLGLLD